MLRTRQDSETHVLRLDPVTLQDQLLRFEGRFSSLLTDAFASGLAAEDLDLRARASRDLLAYLSAALDIASGSSPDVDLLDMVTLVALGRDSVRRRWNEDEHGPLATKIVEAFDAALADITHLARTALPDGVQQELIRIIDDWRLENPKVEAVSTVRLSSYSNVGSGSGTALQQKAAGLFSIVRGAAQTADTAVLLGERALYASQRMPFLLRLHARLAVTDVVADLSRTVGGPANVRAMTRRAERSVNALIVRAAVACGGVALCAATSWFIARWAGARFAIR